MKTLKLILPITFYCIIISCNSNSQTTENISADSLIETTETVEEYECKTFSRENIKKRIQSKKANKEPLIVHVFVPLCDNDHQGIVPVNKSLGNGVSLKTNLYWGAGYGIKTHFKRRTNWKMLLAEKDIDTNILERVVFERQYDANTKVMLIADAYRGDRMEACIRDYFNSLAGLKKDSACLPQDTIALGSNSDLIVFNGHNALMDVDVEYFENYDNIEKDAAVISCLSASYFLEKLKCLKAYPLITTEDYLPPEAYVVEGIIDAWARDKSEEEIRLNTGNAMFKVFKRNQKAMQGIFRTGW